MKKLLYYLNPMVHLGERKYSVLFPLIVNLLASILSELYCYGIAKDPMAVGAYIIFVNVALIVYFSFREGIRGGFISSLITIAYYFYIIDTRHYSGKQYIAGVETTVILALLYFLLAFIIGWLKQHIDRLIEIQFDERQRLETIIQQLPVGAIITDKAGKITHINKRTHKIIGLKIPVGFKIGTDKLKKIKINGKAIIPSQASFLKAITSGKTIIGREFLVEKKDHKKVYLHINSAPVYNKKGKIIAAATIISDITQQKELDQQKDHFLSMASHELKTPITSLKMFIDLQRKQFEKEDTKKAKYYNEKISDQANRLKELTSDLLDVSGIKNGKLHFTLEEFDLSEIIQNTVEDLQGITQQHEIIVSNNKKFIVKGDKYRIYQVLVNLLSNAIKYSPDGKKIIINAKKTKQTVTVSVQDFGIGIGKDQQLKIFDRLYQVNDIKGKNFSGLGLGLYISKEIIVRHKGKLWVESEKGQGSTFFFTLPLFSRKHS